MRGRIYKRGNQWYVDIRGADGRRLRRAAGDNRRNALRLLANLREKIRLAAPTNAARGDEQEEPAQPTVGACWNHYIRRLEAECKPSSVGTAKYVRKRWGGLERKRVSSLQQADIDDLVDAMPGKITTANNSIKTLRAALRRAKRDGLIDAIPVRLDERKHIVPLPLTVSKQEFRVLLSGAEDYRAKTLLMLANYAGLRQQEGLFLILADIDWGKGMLSVTAKPNYGWSPKNYEEREVPLSKILFQALKNHIALMPARKKWEIENNTPEWLFIGRKTGHPMSRPTASRLIRLAFDDANIGGERPGLHRLRKTWATNVLKTSGLGVLMRLGGWNSLETVRRYIGTDDDAARAAIDSLEF